MLPYILAAASLVLIGADLFLLWQIAAHLKKHGDEPLEASIPYLSRRLTAFIVSSVVIAALQIALIILR